MKLNGKMKCGTTFEVCSSSMVNGPSQASGQRFGRCYVYYKIGDGEWIKAPVQSQMKTVVWLESIDAIDAPFYMEYCNQYHLPNTQGEGR